MKTAKIKQAAIKISELYYGEDGKDYVVVEKINPYILELRTELSMCEGGYELMDKIEKLGYDVEYYGQCVYHVYDKKWTEGQLPEAKAEKLQEDYNDKYFTLY